MHSSSIACKSSAAMWPAAKRSRASLSRSGRRKLPTWSARNGGRDMVPPSERATIGLSRCSHAARGLGNRRPHVRARGASSHRLRGEEPPQHRRRLALADAAVDLRRVVAGRLTEEARPVVDRAALRVRRRRNRAGAGGRERSRRRTSRMARASHRDRSRRAVRSRSRRGLADDEHFGMRGRIG